VGDDLLEGRHVVIASGAQPIPLKITGADAFTTSDQFLELEKMPPRIVFVGGGYISFEFAHVAARAGAQVTILHRGERPLGRFDPDLVDLLVRRTRNLGVDIQVQTEVEAIERSVNGLVVHASTGGRAEKFETDLVVHGAGRIPEIEDLNLATAGVVFDQKGVKVNEYLQSCSNPAVYAAGDAAADGPPFTSVAGYEGEIVAANLLKGNHRTTNHQAVPSVVFTMPPLAAVGLSKQHAHEQGLRFQIRHDITSSWYSSRRVGEESSGFKIMVEEGTGRILGAHLLAPHAEEVINLFALAIRFGIRAADLKEFMFAYPTHGSDIWYML
jgi:glutathione reductase (NADPH)